MPKSPKKQQEEEPLGFENAFERLAAIVEKLEEGGLPLDELEKRFEEGLQLARYCNERLTGIEKRVKKLIEQPDGEIAAEDLDSEEEKDGNSNS